MIVAGLTGEMPKAPIKQDEVDEEEEEEEEEAAFIREIKPTTKGL